MCLWGGGGGGEIKRREGRRRKTDGQIDKQTDTQRGRDKKRRGLKRRVTEKQRKNH